MSYDRYLRLHAARADVVERERGQAAQSFGFLPCQDKDFLRIDVSEATQADTRTQETGAERVCRESERVVMAQAALRPQKSLHHRQVTMGAAFTNPFAVLGRFPVSEAI